MERRNRVKYIKMSIHDKINFKAVRIPIFREVAKKRNFCNASKILRISLFGNTWDSECFGVEFKNPILGNGSKSFWRIKNDANYQRLKKENYYLLSTGFC